MAKVETMKEYEIEKGIGMSILEDYLSSDYFNTIDLNDEVAFGDLNIKNSLIFLDELKGQLTDAMDDIIEKYEQAKERYGENIKVDFCKLMNE